MKILVWLAWKCTAVLLGMGLTIDYGAITLQSLTLWHSTDNNVYYYIPYRFLFSWRIRPVSVHHRIPLMVSLLIISCNWYNRGTIICDQVLMSSISAQPWFLVDYIARDDLMCFLVFVIRCIWLYSYFLCRSQTASLSIWYPSSSCGKVCY